MAAASGVRLVTATVGLVIVGMVWGTLSLTLLFAFGSENSFPRYAAKQLHHNVPMQWWVLNLDDGFHHEISTRYVHLEEIASLPFTTKDDLRGDEADSRPSDRRIQSRAFGPRERHLGLFDRDCDRWPSIRRFASCGESVFPHI